MNEKTIRTPGEIIGRQRGACGMSVKTLSWLLDISPSTIGRIEEDDYGPAYQREVERIIYVLRIDDPAEQKRLRDAAKAGAGSDADPEGDDRSRVSEANPLEDALVTAVKEGTVHDAFAIDAAKQIRFMQGKGWHDQTN